MEHDTLQATRLTMRLKDTVKYKHTSGVIRVHRPAHMLPVEHCCPIKEAAPNSDDHRSLTSE